VGPRAVLDDVERRKILPLPGLKLGTLGHAARRYTDCAIPAPKVVRVEANRNQFSIVDNNVTLEEYHLMGYDGV
jgi:hypothetical protein